MLVTLPPSRFVHSRRSLPVGRCDQRTRAHGDRFTPLSASPRFAGDRGHSPEGWDPDAEIQAANGEVQAILTNGMVDRIAEFREVREDGVGLYSFLEMLTAVTEPGAEKREFEITRFPTMEEEVEEAVKALQKAFSHGADVNRYNWSGRAPVHLAASLPPELLNVLQQQPGFDINAELNFTALHPAEHYAKYKARFYHLTGLQMAVHHGSASTVKAFLADPKLDKAKNNVSHLLFYGPFYSNDGPVGLIDPRSNPQASSPEKALWDKAFAAGMEAPPAGMRPRPMMDKAERELWTLLLSRPDIDVNARGEDGRTPLYRAVEAGYTELVGMLLAHGADPTLPSYERTSARGTVVPPKMPLDLVPEIPVYSKKPQTRRKQKRTMQIRQLLLATIAT